MTIERGSKSWALIVTSGVATGTDVLCGYCLALLIGDADKRGSRLFTIAELKRAVKAHAPRCPRR